MKITKTLVKPRNQTQKQLSSHLSLAVGMEGGKVGTPSISKREEEKAEIILCEECKKEAYKYKCPGCSVRSCSLSCVKSHKLRTDCTGKKITQFLPISKFTNNTLFSDYNMLEEVKRVAESAHRNNAKLGGYYHFRLPRPLYNLRNAAGHRSTRLAFLPEGMSKRVTNQSYYNTRRKFISWTIEWRFHSTKVVIVDHGINENRRLSSVIENHLRPGPWINPLRQFSEEPLNSLRFFIRKYSKGPKSPFRELDINRPIGQQLANLYILEYPVIHVFLPSHTFDFEISKDLIAQKPPIKEPVTYDPPSPKGVIFKEEEIEETISSDPKVFDLIKRPNTNHVLETRPEGKFDESLLEENLDKSCKLELENTQNEKDDDVMQPSGLDIDEIELDESIEFDFDEGFLDAFTDLIGQNNPDDFLDLENILSGETRNDLDFEAVEEEELEEGEIPSF